MNTILSSNSKIKVLPGFVVSEIKASAKNDLLGFYFNLGKDIRNAFGLNNGNTVLLGNRSANDTSMKIIEELWKRLLCSRTH